MKILGLAVAALLLTLSTPVFAEPTVQVAGGGTVVVLSTELVAALTSLSVTPDRIKPAKLKRGVAGFPILAGAIDFEDLRGDIFHSGGLSLTSATTTVELRNFVIDTLDGTVLTGLVSVNGDLVGRLPLFDLDLTEAPVINGRRIVIDAVEVTLTAGAAAALNDAFDVSAFAAGLLIGEATVGTRAVPGTDLDVVE